MGKTVRLPKQFVKAPSINDGRAADGVGADKVTLSERGDDA
jgi:hypothetical protein